MVEEPHPDGRSQPDEGTQGHDRSVQWLANYVYGTISTLIAIAGLTFEENPGELSTAGVVVVGAVAIWLAHSLSHLVTVPSWRHLRLTPIDLGRELRGSWSILVAALPATVIFMLAAIHLFSIQTAFTVAEVIGVLALAVVGFGTTASGDLPMVRRIVYVSCLVAVGVIIVLFELLVHVL